MGQMEHSHNKHNLHVASGKQTRTDVQSKSKKCRVGFSNQAEHEHANL